MPQIEKVTPEPGQESVWDYPRPPRVEDCGERVRVVLGDVVIADSVKSKRVLETSHPPVFYIPPADVKMEHLRRTIRKSFCEFKGQATYFTVQVGSLTLENAAWAYLSPTHRFQEITDYLAFYPSAFECFVNDERVQAQPGDFYGGWITKNIVGPFKGEPGTLHW